MAYYNTCDLCGAHLDPGESCDCMDEKLKKIRKKEAARRRMELLEVSEWKQEELEICC